ncbi:hypothetical protein CC1G_04654 [Coprinopsis cinerea okayama7|uniref:Uncharacterized protein n=1 Tax=Coprinopsis cinerea (strain Okayama-7 / 130 / ATCC MYA-4618 / FGSC 9003) TaxID=240176 RepID=A8N547_COPC7|nr:hypothetical protein CC1G_04654 [Coprinopsis cinerea okayama7\|eukprot:XP_001829965.1 hypothetical protein CC1G_04654 [Coprinopsis cinerea okayama7\
MPRTRNVSRSQWDAANAMHNARGRENGGHDDSEKENTTGRVTRSRARGSTANPTTTTTGRTVLGSLSTTRPSASTGPSKTQTRGKGKPPSKGTKTKTEKLPLQDITSRYLPAPESENRGHAQPSGFGEPENLNISMAGLSTFSWTGAADEVGPSRRTRSTRNTNRNPYPSSLPPSSPPSVSSNHNAGPSHSQSNHPHHSLPVLSRSPSPFLDNVSRRLFGPADTIAEEGQEEERHQGGQEHRHVYDAWQDFDFVVPESELCGARAGSSKAQVSPTNSDPFGFFALERKLKEGREKDEDEEVEGVVLVKETSPFAAPQARPSSPGLEYTDPPEDPYDDHHENDNEHASTFNHPLLAHSESFFLPPTPPTPQKKRDRRRSSRHGFEFNLQEEDEIFNPRPSSCPSSPSPSKRSSVKRKAVAVDSDAFNDEVDAEADSTPQAQRQRRPVRKQARTEQKEEEKGDDGVGDDDGRGREGERVLRRSKRGRTSIKRGEDGEGRDNEVGSSRRSRSRNATKSESNANTRTRSSARKSTRSQAAPVKEKKTRSRKAAAILPSDDSDAEAKRERERQARLEYFRKLDEYEVETENVYVI